MCSIYRGLWAACPYTQPGPRGAPCSSLCVWRRLRGGCAQWLSLAVEGGQHSGSRTEIKQFLTSNPSSEAFSECGAAGNRRLSISSCLVPAAQGILLAQGRARHSSRSSQLSACTDYPVNSNLSLLYPTYTRR